MIERLTDDHLRLLMRAHRGRLILHTPGETQHVGELAELELISGAPILGYKPTALGMVVLHLAADSELKGREFGRRSALGEAACLVFTRALPHIDASTAHAINGKKGKERREAAIGMALLESATELLEVANKEMNDD